MSDRQFSGPDRRDLAKLALIFIGMLGGISTIPQFVTGLRAEQYLGRPVMLSALLLLGSYGAGLALTFIAGWIRPAIVRWIAALLLAVSTGVVTAAILVSHLPVNWGTAAMAWDSAGSLVDFIAFNGDTCLISLLFAGAAFIGIGLQPTRRPFDAAALPAIVLGSIGFVLLAGSSRAYIVSATAPGITGLAFAGQLLFGTPPATLDPPPAPVLIPALTPSDGDVVLIVDESIGGHYLDLNRPAGVRSGLQPAPAGVDVANFGIAASATNFSVGTNYILRTGGTRDAYLRRKASIWAYARRAGYRTVHVFAQQATGLQNLMTVAEHAQIDRSIRLDWIPLHERDHETARMLTVLLHDGIRQFIYVNKVGAHIPAWRYYPEQASVYHPTLSQIRKQRKAGNYAWYDQFAPEDWASYRNDYRNAVRWNVKGFFDILLKRGLPAGSTLIYTSDHGETLRERDARVRNVHGNQKNALSEEGAVPMVVLTPAGRDPKWRTAAAAGSGASQYRIFPSLLGIFGYHRPKVEPIFGADLLSAKPDPMTFNSDFYASKPAWHRIVRQDILNPTN